MSGGPYPRFLISVSPQAQLSWDEEANASVEGWGLSLDLLIDPNERHALIPVTAYDFDVPATDEGWREVLTAMRRWCDGRGFSFVAPASDFVFDRENLAGANVSVSLWRLPAGGVS